MSNTTAFTIRPMTGADIDMLQRMSTETFLDTYAAYNTPEDMELHVAEKFNKQKLLDELSDRGNYFFVALAGEAPAGYIKLRTSEEPVTMTGRNHIELERIYAVKQFHGMGLGKMLIDKALETAKAKGHEVLWLGVWKQNEKALQFYQRNGFEIFGEQVFTLGSDPQSDWLMKKELV